MTSSDLPMTLLQSIKSCDLYKFRLALEYGDTPLNPNYSDKNNLVLAVLVCLEKNAMSLESALVAPLSSLPFDNLPAWIPREAYRDQNGNLDYESTFYFYKKNAHRVVGQWCIMLATLIGMKAPLDRRCYKAVAKFLESVRFFDSNSVLGFVLESLDQAGMSWTMRYHQEGKEPSLFTRFFAPLFDMDLNACLFDSVYQCCRSLVPRLTDGDAYLYTRLPPAMQGLDLLFNDPVRQLLSQRREPQESVLLKALEEVEALDAHRSSVVTAAQEVMEVERSLVQEDPRIADGIRWLQRA